MYANLKLAILTVDCDVVTDLVVYKNITNFCSSANCLHPWGTTQNILWRVQYLITGPLKRKDHPKSYTFEKIIFLVILCVGTNWKVVRHYITATLLIQLIWRAHTCTYMYSNCNFQKLITFCLSHFLSDFIPTFTSILSLHPFRAVW